MCLLIFCNLVIIKLEVSIKWPFLTICDLICCHASVKFGFIDCKKKKTYCNQSWRGGCSEFGQTSWLVSSCPFPILKTSTLVCIVVCSVFFFKWPHTIAVFFSSVLSRLTMWSMTSLVLNPVLMMTSLPWSTQAFSYPARYEKQCVDWNPEYFLFHVPSQVSFSPNSVMAG